MEIKLLLGIASAVISVISFFPYLRDIFRGKTRPHAYSWLIWAILQAVGAAAQLKSGGGYGAWVLIVGAVLCAGIFILSFKYGTGNITKFDQVCLFASLATLGCYLFFQNPFWAVLLVTATDLFGFLPTFRKAYVEPSTETSSTFILSAVANLLSLFAIQKYSLTTTLSIS